MTVLDAYAVIAFLRAEPAAGEVRGLLGTDAQLTSVGVAEVLDHLVRVVGADEEEATLDLAQLGLLDGTAVDSGVGAEAGRLRARRYHRARCAVSMADCIAAQTARSIGEPLATSDPHLLDLCYAEGIPTVVLPGSDGSRWVRPD
ncbi:MAG TPA: PIN domain-containing protein [Acidimicrobiales bacterium]|nr:PIN domain-containing protein [Acidimicrobiales bacterium]